MMSSSFLAAWYSIRSNVVVAINSVAYQFAPFAETLVSDQDDASSFIPGTDEAK